MVQSIRGTVALLPQVAQQIHVIALFSLEVSVKKCTRRSRVRILDSTAGGELRYLMYMSQLL